jgi:hypothetical protein
MITPCLVAVRFVVVVTWTSSVAGTPGVVMVVEADAEDWAKPVPDINVRAAVAAIKSFNIERSPHRPERA